MSRRIFSILFILSTAMSIVAQKTAPLRMNNIGGVTQGMTIYAIAQDARGMIWLGTNDGLCSYDGYEIHQHGRSMSKVNLASMRGLGRINCMTVQGDSILIGCEHGMEVFRIKEDKFSPYRLFAGHDVKTISDGWIGTDRGLYVKGRRLGIIRNIFSVSHLGSKIFVGTASSLYVYNGKDFVKVALMSYISGVAAIKTLPGVFFVGTGSTLSTMDCQNQKILKIKPMPVVKTILADGNRLLIGTDNGLYFTSGDVMTKVQHDAFRPDNSLAGNVIWSIFRDRDGNIWIGTDNGVSMMQKHSAISWHYLTDITGRHAGCLIEQILIDKHRRTWLGGSSGLICVENLGNPDETYRWYKMGDARYPLPHNHIRCIYEDKNGRIFAGGDGGMMVYDERTRQFTRHLIKEDRYNWIYDIYGQDDQLVVLTSDNVYLLDGRTFKNLTPSLTSKGRESLSKCKTKGKRNVVTISDVNWYKDANTGLLWIGGNDRFGFHYPEQKSQALLSRKVYITCSEPWGQDGVLLNFSDFDYNPEKQTLYTYRLKGLEDEWHTTSRREHSIRYTHLSPGTYTFEISPKDHKELVTTYDISIPRLWFATIPMLILYAVLFIALIVTIILFFIQRKTILLEREQREVMLETAKRKEMELQQELVQTVKTQDQSIEHPSMDDNFLSTVTQTIEVRMEDLDFSPSMLAESCNVPQKQLYRKLKQLTGMTTVEYIRHLRIERAAYLLSHGNFTVAEVMYRVGFTNASYFSRAFVKLKGMTPSEYKKLLLSDKL